MQTKLWFWLEIASVALFAASIGLAFFVPIVPIFILLGMAVCCVFLSEAFDALAKRKGREVAALKTITSSAWHTTKSFIVIIVLGTLVLGVAWLASQFDNDLVLLAILFAAPASLHLLWRLVYKFRKQRFGEKPE